MINVSFLQAAKLSMFNPSNWVPVDSAYTLEELWDAMAPGQYAQIKGDEAKCVLVEFEDGQSALRLEIAFTNGTSTQLKMSKAFQDSHDEGDTVKVSLIYAQELKKVGQPSIVRYDVWASEEEKEKYLAERD